MHVRPRHRPDKLPSRQYARLACQSRCHGPRPCQSNSAPTPRYPLEAPLDGGGAADERIAFEFSPPPNARQPGLLLARQTRRPEIVLKLVKSRSREVSPPVLQIMVNPIA